MDFDGKYFNTYMSVLTSMSIDECIKNMYQKYNKIIIK